ncbi:hypothetical protein LWI28_009609 [Acer negundo]|uniref:Uncharacterized protein n=1 Tax=Acer negundo TaxID=4023 RepID=A0AAD5NZY6_ACENE|nr:hypothetical protein LWI28_009609 [Acer negundo]
MKTVFEESATEACTETPIGLVDIEALEEKSRDADDHHPELKPSDIGVIIKDAKSEGIYRTAPPPCLIGVGVNESSYQFRVSLPGIPNTTQTYLSKLLQQLVAQFQFIGGSNNVWGSIPTTYPAFEIPSVNPIISKDPTINEVVAKPYNEDERSILEYNPNSEYGINDFDEDCIGHGRSLEGDNDEPAHYNGIGSDPTDGGRTGSVPLVFTGPSWDTF